ncbi:MAG: EamA family transporter [Blautia sp.]|nr:EamA family transporter [Blautia sp.]
MKLTISMVIFGTIGIVRRFIPFPSSMIAMVRGFVGAAFLLGVLFFRKEEVSWPNLKKNLWKLCLSGALIGANWICLFEAYRYTSVSVATICYYMAPVFVMLAAPLILHEKMTLRKSVCSAAALFGMVLVSGVCETGLSGMKGILFGLSAAIMYACVVLLNQFIKDLTAYERTLVQLLMAATAVTPYVLLTEDLRTLQPDAFIILMLLIAGIIHTGFAYTLYFGSMNRIPAQTVALFSYIDPVVAVILSVLVLRERMSTLAAFGVFLVIGAMVVSELSGKK